MNNKLRIFLSLSLLATSSAALMVACSDEDPKPPVTAIDGGGDADASDLPDTNDLPDTALPDTGPVVADAYVSPSTNDAAVCPIVGFDDQAFNWGGPVCNNCVAVNCCDLMNQCSQVPNQPPGTAYPLDGGANNTCTQRLDCTFDECIGATDGNDCQKTKCDPKFDATINTLANKVLGCAYGPKIGTVVPGTCSWRETDGGLLCYPN